MELRTFKINSQNLTVVSVLNKTASNDWKSEVRDLIPIENGYYVVSVMVTGYYPFMDGELKTDAEKLLDTKQGETLFIDGECMMFDKGDWVSQEKYYDDYPNPVIDKFRKSKESP